MDKHKRHHLQAAARWGVGLGLLSSTAVLLGCGFRLRGINSSSVQFAFKTIFSSFAPGSSLGIDFKRAASAQGLLVLDDASRAQEAEIVLRIHQDTREKAVVGASVGAQVREFELRVRCRFSLFTRSGKLLLDEVSLVQQRAFSYTETQALAKEAEEQQLYKDMQQELVAQLLRRLAAVKL